MPVKTNLGEGANIRNDTATEANVLAGKTFHAGKSQKQKTGTMTDNSGTSKSVTAALDTKNSQVQMPIPASGYYDTAAKLYSAFSDIAKVLGLTAAKIAYGTAVLGISGTYKGAGTATADKVLNGYTFSSASLSGASGTMPNLTEEATITHTSSNSTKVIVGDAAFVTTNSDGTDRFEIRYNGDAGYISTTTLFAVAYSAVVSAIGLTAASIATGVSILGVTGTYKGLGDASAADVLTGKTFSTASLSNETGTMADKTGTTQEATASLDTTNSRVQLKIPATGKYNTSSYLYAAYSTIASLIGLTASAIATGTSILGITGSYKGVGTAAAAQVLTGYTFSSASLSGANGSMANKGGTTQEATASLDTTNSRLQLTIPATGYYNTSAKLYAAYSTIRSLIGLTAAKIATGNTVLGLVGSYKGVGTATAAQVLTGYTFSSASLSGADGAMPDKNSVVSSIGGMNSSYSSVALNQGNTVQLTLPTNQSAQWLAMQPPKGYYNGNNYVGTPIATLISVIGLTAAKLGYGKTCLGLTGTYKPTVTQISAIAACGFGSSSSNSELSEEDSYTCTAAGTCYYNGFAASESGSSTVTCEIYKNGTLVDSRNIDSSNAYNWRGTMQEKSFSVVSGDVIKVKAAVTFTSSSYSKMSHIDATIVTYA